MRLLRAAAGALVVAAGLVALIDVALPGVAWLATATPRQSSFMRWTAAHTGRAPDAYAVEALRLESVSPWLVCAVLKSEDRMFFRHRGFDWPQLEKAAGRWSRGERTGGASTISQQLARNLYLTPERTLIRKTREALLTEHLERALPKERILELYLNFAEWGDGVWGAEQAARAYFDEPASELGPFEASFLASMLPAPRAPLQGVQVKRQRVIQDRVLRKLMASGLLDVAAFERAMQRGGAVRARLRVGQPLADALAATRAIDAGPAPPLSLASVLASQCGLDAELAEEASEEETDPG